MAQIFIQKRVAVGPGNVHFISVRQKPCNAAAAHAECPVTGIANSSHHNSGSDGHIAQSWWRV